MAQRRAIGRSIQAEQELPEGDNAWLVAIAKAVLRAFVWGAGQPMQTLANELGVSRPTLYAKLRLVIQALMWIRHGKALGETWVAQGPGLQPR